MLRSWLEDESTLFIGANVAFDFGCVLEAYPDLRPAVFRAYRENRVTDVQIRQRLIDIAGGCYGGWFGAKGVFIKYAYDLESLAKRNVGMVLQKDAWRLSYGNFIGVPLSQWPAKALEVQARGKEQIAALRAEHADLPLHKWPSDAKKRLDGLQSMVHSDPQRCTEYPLDDARATLAVWQAQEKHAAFLKDQYRQTYAALWLHLSSAWGIRTDAEGVRILAEETRTAHEEAKAILVSAGLAREDGSRDTKAAKRWMLEVCAREGLRVRRTDGHAESGKCKRLDGTSVPDGAEECEEHVCLDADACKATDDEVLAAYAEFSELGKVLSNDVEALSKGTAYPLHTRYGLAETGRTTSSKPNIQNLRRRAGIREAFVPRTGCVFVAADYPTLELYTLAQCCKTWLGKSALGDALNAGLDPHLRFAASMRGISYEDALDRYKAEDPEIVLARFLAKAANFGFPGGMGFRKFVEATRKQMSRAAFAALGLDETRARRLKEEWFEAWPELPGYFARVNALCENGSGFVETLWTERFRGGASYCAACNNGFQALGSDCAKRAGCLIAEAQYVRPECGAASPLFDTRTVAFVHDEFILESVEETAHEAALELARLMVEGANVYLPDVPIPRNKIQPLLMRRWSKKAKPVYAGERLIPWAA